MYTHKITCGKNADAMSIRIEVFAKEQGFIEEYDEIDEYAHTVVIYQQQIPVATGRVFKTDQQNVWKVGRLAVKKEFRNEKLGSKVMLLVEKVVKENSGIATKLSAQIHAKGFYEKLGYKAISDVYIEDGAEHIMMKKEI